MDLSSIFMTRISTARKKWVAASSLFDFPNISRLILYGMGRRKELCRCRRSILLNCGIQCKTVRSSFPRSLVSGSYWRNSADDFNAFNKVNTILLNPASPLKHIPLRIYIPSSPTASAELGSFKIVQTLVPPATSKREVQTLGSALNTVLPSLFPSRRDAILAEPILHGAPVPFRAPLEQLMREAAYADGWLHLSVSMIDAWL